MNELYTNLFNQLYYFQISFNSREVDLINFIEWVYWSPLKCNELSINILNYDRFIEIVKEKRQSL